MSPSVVSQLLRGSVSTFVLPGSFVKDFLQRLRSQRS